jgi:hypothetical protein
MLVNAIFQKRLELHNKSQIKQKFHCLPSIQDEKQGATPCRLCASYATQISFPNKRNTHSCLGKRNPME